MTARSIGDEAQIRSLIETVGKGAAAIAISEFVAQHPEVRRGTVVSEIPAPLKWAGAIIASLFTAGTATLAFWLVSTVSEMQVTLARMDERMAAGVVRDGRFDPLERRVSRLEAYHSEGGQ